MHDHNTEIKLRVHDDFYAKGEKYRGQINYILNSDLTEVAGMVTLLKS